MYFYKVVSTDCFGGLPRLTIGFELFCVFPITVHSFFSLISLSLVPSPQSLGMYCFGVILESPTSSTLVVLIL